ncbi:S8 family peptidase [Pelotomaculum propionicicum]|uniref:Serine protease AprX n=1 Tax=Pelotomaculum propionicicum TaxID=258475 RepID=A0A4Y7RLK9_9FIRM|nr:S8 family peptidase [Pelotomaculum propionicicum]NLI14485.1 S8 family peptidase [Peptococcaceae bacterium]TEB09562.1 Serine protease AprX [Pelotomaculum propionicicum]
MIYQEVSWIRANAGKLCPQAKKAALEWYRPLKKVPCFLQKPFKYLKQLWRKIPVIVQLEKTRSEDISIKDFADSLGCVVHRELGLIHSFATRVGPKQLELLSQNSLVRKIWYDREVKAVLDVAAPVVQSQILWERSLTGRGIVVAVLDTGIYEHPDLAGRIVAFKDLVKQKTDPYDDNGHGTHCAGDIGADGSQSGSLYRGPAYEAGLVGVKVLNKMGSGSLSTVIEGIQWCIDNKESLGIRVLSMSLGSSATESHVSDPVCQAVEAAWSRGIVVCVAAGNEGPEAGTISSPGISPQVITVGALDDNNTVDGSDDQVADFSSRGPTIDGLVKPDVLAPGVNIISLRSPGAKLDKQNKSARVDKWYFSLSGTSMATPVCAGVVAQILQSDTSLTPDQVKARLINSAQKIPALDPNTQGAGLITANWEMRSNQR